MTTGKVMLYLEHLGSRTSQVAWTGSETRQEHAPLTDPEATEGRKYCLTQI